MLSGDSPQYCGNSHAHGEAKSQIQPHWHEMEEKMNTYRVFTIASGDVTAGAVIETLRLKGAGIDIPAIMIGEEGRGRERGVVPISNPPMIPCPNRGEIYSPEERCGQCGTQLGPIVELGAPSWSRTRHHPETGQVLGRLLFAEVGSTKAGKPKFFSNEKATTDEKIIVVFNTSIGYRGGNSHTGDRAGWKCSRCDASGEGNVPETCPKCGVDDPTLNFAAFPGEIITTGHIAQGDAGRMGSGEQLVAVMPKGVVFRTAYSGRLYGAPAAHYYKWDGERLLAATWSERAATDIF